MSLKNSEWFKLTGHRTGGRDEPLVAFSESKEFYSVDRGQAELGYHARGTTGKIRSWAVDIRHSILPYSSLYS